MIKMTDGVQVIDAWIPLSEYMEKSGLGKTACENRMKNGQLKWKYGNPGRRLIHCKMTKQ